MTRRAANTTCLGRLDMARARNIKPGLFKNEILGVADPLLTILFESLWCLADREGRLEDRPLRIKAETFPYRENIDVNGCLTVLAQYGFIHRYEVEGIRYIQVAKFKEHQSPHKTERDSVIPAMPENYQEKSNGCVLTVQQPLTADGLTASLPPDSLIPDSLNTDSLIPEKNTCAESQSASTPVVIEHPVISIPRNDNSNHPITQSQIDRWSELYPAVNVLQELRSMVGWSDANKSKRKTKSGMERFINAWLSKAQNTPARHGAQHERTRQPGTNPINWDDTSWGDNLDAALDIG